MTWIFDKKSVESNRNTRAQWAVQNQHRQFYTNSEKAFEQTYGVNASAALPLPYYLEFDRQTKAILTDPTVDVLYNDMLSLSRAIDIGKMVHQYRQSGTDEAVTTSLSGLEPIPHVGSSYAFDGAIIPVHQSGFYQEWRERAGKQTDSYFDDWLDQQAASVRSVRTRMSDYILDGAADLQFKGVPSYGLRNGANVTKGEIAIDFTAAATTGTQVFDEFRRLVYLAQHEGLIANDLTFYVSAAIMQKLGEFYAVDGNLSSNTILEVVQRIPGIAAIKKTSRLQGNEMIAGVLSQEFIVPLVGQATSTVILPRQTPFARHEGIVWSAMGIEVRADINGVSGWAYFSAENP